MIKMEKCVFWCIFGASHGVNQMKTKLIPKWEKTNYGTMKARLDNFILTCFNVRYSKPKLWSSKVVVLLGIDSFPCTHTRCGPNRKSKRLSQLDAERLVRDIKADLREGARLLMNKYGDEDDD